MGTYTLYQAFGSPAVYQNSGTFTLEDGFVGTGSYGNSPLTWAVSDRIVTITSTLLTSGGQPVGQVAVFIGKRTRFGIASVKHPGSETTYVGGTPFISGLFYAVRN